MRRLVLFAALILTFALGAPAATPASSTTFDPGQLSAFLDGLGGLNHSLPIETDSGLPVTGAYVDPGREAIILSTRPAAVPPAKSGGVLLPPRIAPRQIAALAYNAGPKWRDARVLVRAVAVCLAESQGYAGSWNDNLDEFGAVASRDVGLWQINIPASQIGTQIEVALHDPVTNAAAAYALYEARGFQPWVAFNTDTFLHATYVARATLGVANFLEQQLVGDALAAGQTTLLRVPFVSIPDLRVLYPGIPLG